MNNDFITREYVLLADRIERMIDVDFPNDSTDLKKAANVIRAYARAKSEDNDAHTAIEPEPSERTGEGDKSAEASDRDKSCTFCMACGTEYSGPEDWNESRNLFCHVCGSREVHEYREDSASAEPSKERNAGCTIEGDGS